MISPWAIEPGLQKHGEPSLTHGRIGQILRGVIVASPSPKVPCQAAPPDQKLRIQYRRWESNLDGHYRPEDFK
jgi:hypothetical protein